MFSLHSFGMAEYTIVESKRADSAIDRMPKGQIADMSEIPQDPSFYAKQLKTISYKEQLLWDKEYNRRYFKAWTLQAVDKTREEMDWPIRSIQKIESFDEKGRLIAVEELRGWITNSNFSALNSIKKHAITTKHTNVRALPTTRALYHDPKEAGEGFPFDYNQNSSYHINTPLYISHYSLDGKWAFVRGSTAYGWVLSSDIAIVDSAFKKQFQNNRYAIVVKDNLGLYSDTQPLTIVKLGTLFPMAGKKGSYLFAARDAGGRAILSAARTQKDTLIVKKPIPMTPNNVAAIAKQFQNEPYGWGGLMQTRDCSSFTKDYFAPFGIFLRRNSSKQIGEGKYSSLFGLPKAKKKEAILANAKPFQSMLYVPGHIVLYLGQYKGEPVIMHTYWGTRLEDGTKKVLGRNVITTTEPGKELSDIKESSKLSNTLSTIVTPGI